MRSISFVQRTLTTHTLYIVSNLIQYTTAANHFSFFLLQTLGNLDNVSNMRYALFVADTNIIASHWTIRFWYPMKCSMQRGHEIWRLEFDTSNEYPK